MRLADRIAASLLFAAALGAPLAAPAAAKTLEGVPRFDHVFVIVEENKEYDQIVGGDDAPNIARLAKTYGDATKFYGEVHPSEANYVALLGGDTFGIHDDDPFYCNAESKDPTCALATSQPGYPDHTVHAPHLGDQLAAAGLTWKGYYESLPAPGSLAYIAGDPKFDNGTRKTALYASKHSGFVNFASAQVDPDRAKHLVGFDQLDADIADDRLPSFALIVPNQCNEMHGLFGVGVPPDCVSGNVGPLIRRGDAVVGKLVERLQATKAWRSHANVAIIITFDEGSGGDRAGCCGVTPSARSNYGGGHIPTIVITNHGPRGLADDTPYNHYSLLRTLEDAFGVAEHLGHAAESDNGVAPMARLFGGG
jgi:phospholipase C